jgi:hypothetical protein
MCGASGVFPRLLVGAYVYVDTCCKGRRGNSTHYCWPCARRCSTFDAAKTAYVDAFASSRTHFTFPGARTAGDGAVRPPPVGDRCAVAGASACAYTEQREHMLLSPWRFHVAEARAEQDSGGGWWSMIPRLPAPAGLASAEQDGSGVGVHAGHGAAAPAPSVHRDAWRAPRDSDSSLVSYTHGFRSRVVRTMRDCAPGHLSRFCRAIFLLAIVPCSTEDNFLKRKIFISNIEIVEGRQITPNHF